MRCILQLTLFIGDQNQQMIQEILSCFEMKNPTKDKRAVRNAVARKITM